MTDDVMDKVHKSTLGRAYQQASDAADQLDRTKHDASSVFLVWAYDTLLNRLDEKRKENSTEPGDLGVMIELEGKLRHFGVQRPPPESKKKLPTAAVDKRSRRYVPTSLAMTDGPLCRSVLSSAMSASAMSASVPEDDTFLVLGGNTSLDI